MDTWAVIVIAVAAVGVIMTLAGTWLQKHRSRAATPDRAAVIQHLKDGHEVEAIRAYRQQTGAGLLEAKQAVDRIAEGLPNDQA